LLRKNAHPKALVEVIRDAERQAAADRQAHGGTRRPNRLGNPAARHRGRRGGAEEGEEFSEKRAPEGTGGAGRVRAAALGL